MPNNSMIQSVNKDASVCDALPDNYYVKYSKHRLLDNDEDTGPLVGDATRNVTPWSASMAPLQFLE